MINVIYRCINVTILLSLPVRQIFLMNCMEMMPVVN